MATIESEEEGIVTPEEKHQPATEETSLRASFTTSRAVTQPLLQHKHQDSRDENRIADMQTLTDGADRKTSVPQEQESACRDQPGCSGSVRSLYGDSSRHECPICSELFDPHGVALLNCNHTLCHHCISGIMRRAKDPGQLQCPFCRQTTPFPQWEIQRLQEESYSHNVYEAPSSMVISPILELQAVPASKLCCFTMGQHSRLFGGLRLIRVHSFCISVVALVLILWVVPLFFMLPR